MAVGSAAGFKYKIVIDGITTNFKTFSYEDANEGIESSAKLNEDGSENTGYRNRNYDLSGLQMTLTELAQSATDERGDITTQPGGGFYSGYDDSTVDWEISYDEIPLFTGVGLYCKRLYGDGSIPGEGKISAAIESKGPYTKHGGGF